MFVFLIQVPEDDFHKESTSYEQSKGRLRRQFQLFPAQIDGLDTSDLIKLLAATYLSHLDDFATLEIADFELEQFKQDLTKVFESAGLRSTEASEA